MTDTWDLTAKAKTWKFFCSFCSKQIPSGRWHDACMENALKEWREEE